MRINKNHMDKKQTVRDRILDLLRKEPDLDSSIVAQRFGISDTTINRIRYTLGQYRRKTDSIANKEAKARAILKMLFDKPDGVCRQTIIRDLGIPSRTFYRVIDYAKGFLDPGMRLDLVRRRNGSILRLIGDRKNS